MASAKVRYEDERDERSEVESGDCYAHDFERVDLPEGITVNGNAYYDVEM